jgi:hypothetical protein
MLEYFEKLAALITFKPDGKPYWVISPANAAPAGSVAGTINSSGHRQINCTINGVRKQILAHRVLWYIEKKSVPTFRLDHEDRNPDNNIISNLRPATQAENMQNKGVYKNNKLGILGVSKHSVSGFNAAIQIAGVQYTHWFKTLEAAVAWRKEQEVLLHPFRPVIQ